MKSEKNHLTKKECELMKILWGSDKPLLISEIIDKADKIAANSLHPMIKRLIKNGYIRVAGYIRVSKTKSRLYAPAINIDEYAAMQIEKIEKISSRKLNWNNILTYFVKHNKKDENVIAELKEFIEKYEKKNETGID